MSNNKTIKKKHNNIILFIDEIHALVSYREWGIMDLFKPYLSTGNKPITVIGATTFSEFSLLECDQAFMRRFNQVIVPKLSLEEMFKLLVKYFTFYIVQPL